MKLFDIPVHYFRQYLFCPRIPFFLEQHKNRTITPLWVDQGSEHHVKQQQLMSRRTLLRFDLEKAQKNFKVPLYSDKYYFHGVSDLILETDDFIYPVEFKLHGNHPKYSQIIQLTAYALLAEEVYQKKCEKGFILFEERGKTHTISIDESKRNNTLKIADKMRRDLESVLPESPASEKQCAQCEFLSFCNDRE